MNLPSWIIDDLAKSGITPDDFPLPITETSNGYKIRYAEPLTGAAMLDLKGREYFREKLRVPSQNKKGKTAKYITEKDAGMRIFFPKGVHECLTSENSELNAGTEGEKKSIAATRLGFPCLGLAGIWGWLESKEKRSADKYMLHGDLTPYLNRDFLIIYDSDAVDESKAIDFDYCAFRFAEAFDKYGRKLYRVNLPADGAEKVGLDDYLLKHSVEDLRDFIQENKHQVTPHENPKCRKLQILLPVAGKLISEFAKECFTIIAGKKEVFLYSDSMCRISTTKKKDAKTEKVREIAIFKNVTSSGFVTELEKYLIPVSTVKNKDTGEFVNLPRSIGEQLARIVCECSEREILPMIRLISSVPLPYFNGNEICLSDHGYDEVQEIWTAPDCPLLNPIPLDEAVSIIRELLSEFCFLEPELDLSRSVAYLLTPMLKLIAGDCRAMIFYASGNRSGVGKDLLLGLAPVLFTGKEPYFSAPCKDDDEYRKLIFSSCMEGAEFLLISNISGHFKSDPIEQGATSIHLAGRVLGKSLNKRLLNNAVWGFSGNGLSLSEDLVRRSLEIRFEKYEEDITQQEFKHSDLYGYAIKNRDKILSALLTFIVNWKMKGSPLGASVRSFTRWSQVTSGIIKELGFPCPFSPRQKLTSSMTLGGNRDAGNLKLLVEAWYEKHGIANVKADDLRSICEELGFFFWLEMEKRSGQVQFAKLLTRFGGREFSGLKIHIEDNTKYKNYYLEKVA